MIEAFRNHPSIVMWVPFNEGWGQFDTPRVVDMIRKLDPTRLVNNASGWTDRGVGDVMDMHQYPGPAVPRLEEKRAVVLGEFGGLGLPVPGHTWQAEKNWGYRSFTTARGADRRLPGPDPQAPPDDRRPGPVRRRLHADDRRGGRGQRPDDLRPRDDQDGRRSDRRREQDPLHAAAAAPGRRRQARPARHAAGRVRPVLQHLVPGGQADRRGHRPLDRQAPSADQHGPHRRQALPRHGRQPGQRAGAAADESDRAAHPDDLHLRRRGRGADADVHDRRPAGGHRHPVAAGDLPDLRVPLDGRQDARRASSTSTPPASSPSTTPNQEVAWSTETDRRPRRA